jgi:hypothetical protein
MTLQRATIRISVVLFVVVPLLGACDAVDPDCSVTRADWEAADGAGPFERWERAEPIGEALNECDGLVDDRREVRALLGPPDSVADDRSSWMYRAGIDAADASIPKSIVLEFGESGEVTAVHLTGE